MRSNSKLSNGSKAGILLAFKMFHKIAFKFLGSINHVLTRNRARSLQYDTNSSNETRLEAEDILKRCIAHLPFFMVKDILCHESIRGIKCISASTSKTIVSPDELHVAGNTFNRVDLEFMMTRLLYIALQFYVFGNTTKNIGSIQSLTNESDLFLEPIEIPEQELSGRKLVSCECPPIFGYMIPLDFFGNILGHEHSCGKTYAHISYPSYRQYEVDEYGDTNNCSQLKPIGYEVKSKTKNTAVNVLVDELLIAEEMSYQVDILKINKELAFLENQNCHIQVSADFEIAPDDGAHPLLDCPEPDEDVKISKELKDFLARAFSEKGTVILDEKQTMCNPPCSVWCDSVNARCYTSDVLKARNSDESSNYGIFKRNLDLIKPVFAKSVSTNGPEYFGYDDIQTDNENSQMSQKPKELPTVREGPSNLKVPNNKRRLTKSLSSRNRQDSHYNVLDKRAFTQNAYLRQRSRRSTWSFVEDESSLWQYLPDCIPDDNILLQPTQKQTRDLRRQKSLT